jgi:hypothetical protein
MTDYTNKNIPLHNFLPEKRTSWIGRILDFFGLHKYPKIEIKYKPLTEDYLKKLHESPINIKMGDLIICNSETGEIITTGDNPNGK